MAVGAQRRKEELQAVGWPLPRAPKAGDRPGVLPWLGVLLSGLSHQWWSSTAMLMAGSWRLMFGKFWPRFCRTAFTLALYSLVFNTIAHAPGHGAAHKSGKGEFSDPRLQAGGWRRGGRKLVKPDQSSHVTWALEGKQ